MVGVDDTDEKNSEDIINEYFHVEPFEETNNLHWLDPEIPPSTAHSSPLEEHLLTSVDRYTSSFTHSAMQQ